MGSEGLVSSVGRRRKKNAKRGVGLNRECGGRREMTAEQRQKHNLRGSVLTCTYKCFPCSLFLLMRITRHSQIIVSQPSLYSPGVDRRRKSNLNSATCC